MESPNVTRYAGTRSLGSAPSRARRRISRSSFGRAVRNYPFAIVGLVIAVLFLAVALFPGLFTRYDPVKLSLTDRLLPPSAQHWLGTDHLGMDVYSRVIYGARTTLKVVVTVLAMAAGIGLVLGSVAGYLGGRVDTVLMRITDVFLAFPSLVLAIAINATLGRGLTSTMMAVGFTWWPPYARLVRAQILAGKNEEYVTAARAVGASPFRILVRHVLRNCFDPILVKITLDGGFIALTTAGLSFLGLGAKPPTPEWGRMVAEGREFLLTQWWITTFPGLALCLIVVSSNLIGELVRDWLDPSGIGRR